MKKGISIWSFAEGSLETCFQLAKKAGFDGVEVALAETGEINLESTREDIIKIKRTAEKAEIELYSVASGLYWTYNYTASDSVIREKAKEITKKQLQIASWLGCDTILVVPGAVGVDFVPGAEVIEYDIAYERATQALKELALYAEELGVTIGVENVWNQFLLSPLELAGFIDGIGSAYVGAYFDVGNVLFCGYPEHWIKILGNRIKKVHFKDYRKAAGGLHGFVDLLAGDVNFPAVMKSFSNIGYEGWVTAEMLPPYKYFSETLLYNTSNAMDKILGRT